MNFVDRTEQSVTWLVTSYILEFHLMTSESFHISIFSSFARRNGENKKNFCLRLCWWSFVFVISGMRAEEKLEAHKKLSTQQVRWKLSTKLLGFQVQTSPPAMPPTQFHSEIWFILNFLPSRGCKKFFFAAKRRRGRLKRIRFIWAFPSTPHRIRARASGVWMKK